ncbi:MAG: HNH endonuclease [Parvularcula sp.]
MQVRSHAPDGCPALVLNADFRPLSYFPLSLWSWQDTLKAVFLDRVDVVAEYEREVASPTFRMRLPSVVSLKTYVNHARKPAFTRFNVFLRDGFACQYCGKGERSDLTFDHVVPRSKGGKTTWQNIVAACSPCNLRKGNKMPRDVGMFPAKTPRQPNMFELNEKGRAFPPNYLHESWTDFLYWDTELEP